MFLNRLGNCISLTIVKHVVSSLLNWELSLKGFIKCSRASPSRAQQLIHFLSSPSGCTGSARAHQRPGKVSFRGMARYRQGTCPKARQAQVPDDRSQGEHWQHWTESPTSSFCEDSARLLCHCSMQQVAQLRKKVVINKSAHCFLLLVTTLFKRSPQQAPSREEHHERIPQRVLVCTHANTQTQRPAYLSKIRKISLQILQITWGGGSCTCRSSAFAAILIHHLHLPSYFKVKFQSA